MTNNLDLNALRAKLEELKTGQTMDPEYLDKFVQLQDGEQIIRLLPAVDGGNGFFAETALHRINDHNVHCPRAVLGRPCAICNYVRKLWNTNTDENIAVARQIKARKRYYFNCIVREERQQDGSIVKNAGPKILSVGVKLFEKFLAVFFDEDYGDPTDLQHGFDFKVIKTQKDGYPNYDKTMPRPKPTPAGTPEEIERWMNNLHDLSALITIKTPEEIQEELNIFLSVNGEVPQQPTTATTTPVQSSTVAAAPQQLEQASVDEVDDFQTQLDKIRSGL